MAEGTIGDVSGPAERAGKAWTDGIGNQRAAVQTSYRGRLASGYSATEMVWGSLISSALGSPLIFERMSKVTPTGSLTFQMASEGASVNDSPLPFFVFCYNSINL